MPPVIGFIGWHNSGKTTLASKVVALLKEKGYKVAVIKSTKDTGIGKEQPQTDTAAYWRVGADSVALLAPDQLLLRSRPLASDLLGLAHRYFFDMDIVIAEGFKYATQVPKIEVRRDKDSPLLRDQVEGVVAVATDLPLTDGLVFGLEQSQEIAEFIEARFLTGKTSTAAPLILTLNGETLSLPEPLHQQWAASLRALLALSFPSVREGILELDIRCQQPSEEKPDRETY